jgi:hypothetical protein
MNMRCHTVAATAFATALFAAAAAHADPVAIATPDLTLIPLVTSGAEYVLSNSSACADLGGNEFCVQSAQHLMFPGGSISFSGGNEIETVPSEVIAQVSVNGGPAVTADLFGPATVTAFGRTSDSETGTFATQMVFDLTGSIAGNSVEFKSDPANPTSGSATFSIVNGTPYTQGYFDVFPEISVDGSPFVPETVPDGAVQVAQLESVPEPASIGVLALGLAGLARVRRTRRS